ncbi:hypothetical protein MNQ95_00635 [Pseudoxanthomonas daejeonensis]|uniref:Secreted protein n=2 Tax=Pseudoxanthomonas daejeonensis TaxID=266062 RepID=A0ABQ6Z8U4_9GAMM|nr:hypothetical protein [Pseudoxanthomonas daejeonensis]KAF1695901.1 hypothetical protein CSC65_05210 [Pseudoxanthomonas daejeonensis]UNK57666.1 hypothetical protein MNQ95_00635 [Pseudoxanthomonas daejeonensis]
MLALVAGLALAPLSDAHASLGNPVRQDASPLRVEAPVAPESRDAADPSVQPAPRRSRMADVAPEDRLVMRFSAMYQEIQAGDKPPPDHCLQGTGSRLKREGGGSTGCSGYGRAYFPER